jgi:hypothetical protein
MFSTLTPLHEPFTVQLMNYVIVDKFGGVPEGDKYMIPDTPESEREWRALLSAFTHEFSECKATEDFGFADWHHNVRSIFAYLYSEKFYNENFLPRVQGILRKHRTPSFAQFESANGKPRDGRIRFLGSFMVFKDNIIFNRLSEERELLNKLIPKAK